MPLKIIQTFEKGNTVLTCVPHQWDRNGVLYWPRKRQQSHKLQKDEGSQPDGTLHRLNCTVKRWNIKTYQDAIDILVNYSTYQSDVCTTITNRYFMKRTKQRTSWRVVELIHRTARNILKYTEQNTDRI